MALTREQMRVVIIEHVEAENAHDPARVIATYSREAPVFEDVAAGVRYEGGEAIVNDNYKHLWDGFPGLQREIVRWTFGDDAVVIELRLTASTRARIGASRQAAANWRSASSPTSNSTAKAGSPRRRPTTTA